MGQIKVSVIIPVYNVEKYLKECLDSVIGQTLKDIEIICVNDGSTDGSGAILDEYAARDKRIKVLNQENKGAGEARNEGINLAEGEYLLFLDGDDVFEPSMCEKLYMGAVGDDLDITICHCSIFKECEDGAREELSSSWVIREDVLPDKKVFNGNDIPGYIIGFCNGWAWDKLYKREFILKNNLRFQNLKSTNDMLFTMLSLVLAEKISVIDDVLINHRVGNKNSVSNSRDNHSFCFIEAIYELKNELLKRDLYKKFEQAFINWNVEFCFWQLDTLELKENKIKLAQTLKKEVFPRLRVYDFKKDYFYNKKTYRRVHFKNLCDAECWYQKIFSIKNQCRPGKVYKVITILGVKLKFKKKGKRSV